MKISLDLELDAETVEDAIQQFVGEVSDPQNLLFYRVDDERYLFNHDTQEIVC